jgi:AsmA protein
MLREVTIQARRVGYDPAGKSIEIDTFKLRAAGDQAGAPISAELDWPLFQLRGDELKGSGLAGQLERRGSSPASATFKTAALEGTFDAMRIPGLDAQLAAEAGGQKLAGSLRGQFAVQPPKQTAQWTLAGRIADNAFETNGSIVWAGAAPTLRAQMRFDSLDLNTLMPPPAKAAAPSAAASAAPLDATPVDLAPLRAINGSLNLRAAKLKLRQIQLTETRLDATLEAGMLRIPTLQAKAWGGQIDANASADARSQRITLKANAAGIDIRPLLKDVADKDMLEGRGRVALDVATGGRTVGALRSALGGTASLQLRDGAVKGVNLAKTLRQAKAALAGRQDEALRVSQTEKTDFSELAASFAILNGVARNSDLDLKSPFLRLGGDGTIDIGRSQIDYTARATVVSSAAGQDAGELESLKGVTIPVRLTGPLEAIDWKVQWSAVAASALKGKAEQKLREKLGEKLGAPAGSASSPKELLKEKLLKGLKK